LLFVTLQAFGIAPVEQLSYYRLTAPHSDSRLLKALDRLVDLTCAEESAGRIMVVGAEHLWFNANTLSMISSDRKSRVERKCYYTSLGYAESNTDRAWTRVVDLHPPFYVAIDYGAPGKALSPELRAAVDRTDAFNRVSRRVPERVESSGRFAVVPTSRSNGFVVFKWVGQTQ
jgi:hypothetical protein